MPDPDGSPTTPSAPRRGLKFLRAGLLIAGSAFFGGLAVAFWDRKSLAKLRQPPQRPPQPPVSSEDDNAG
jgi:hypothetical protein